MNRFRRLFRSDANRNRLHVPPGIRQAQPFLKNILFPAIRTMDFSGATTLMTTFNTFSTYEWETSSTVRNGALAMALVYAFASLLCGFVGVWCGAMVAEAFSRERIVNWSSTARSSRL